MKFLVESEFQGQEPPRTQETTKTTSTIRTPRVGFGTDRPYITLYSPFLGPTFGGFENPPRREAEYSGKGLSCIGEGGGAASQYWAPFKNNKKTGAKVMQALLMRRWDLYRFLWLLEGNRADPLQILMEMLYQITSRSKDEYCKKGK